MEVATNRPRFRTDLVAECIEAEGQRFIDVIDPDTGDAFRFYEVEYSLACAMDGERDLVGLASWAREELGIEPSPDELRNVIATLGELGYLEAQPVAVAAAEVAARSASTTASAATSTMGDELGVSPGVFAAPREVAPPSGLDVALGEAGSASLADEPMPEVERVELGHVESAPAPARVLAAAPSSDVELGTAGGAPAPMATLRRQTQPVANEYDEPTNLPAPQVSDFDDEVSVDLSEHLAIGRDDVKEAVRMSRGMKAVEVPAELLAELEQKEAEAAAASRAVDAARSAPEMVVEADEPTPPPRDVPVIPPLAKPVPVVEAEATARPAGADKAPVELPSRQVHVATRDKKADKAPEKVADKAEKAAEKTEKSPYEKPVPVAKPGGVSPLLIILLVLALLGGGGFLVWKYVINKPKAEATGTSEPAPKVGTGKATGVATATGAATGTAATPPPAPITATLEMGPAGGTPITAGGKGGVILFIVPAGTQVDAGAVVAKFQGVAALEKKLGDSKGGMIWDIETRYPKEIEKAQAAGDAAKVKERTKRLEERTKEADAIRAKIAELTVTAPAAGTIEAPVSRGKRVAAGEPVAMLAGAASLVATFDVATSTRKDWAVDQPVQVSAQETPDQQVDCAVSAVDGTKVTVTCAADSGLVAGATVALAP